jgi:hypothetical protein
MNYISNKSEILHFVTLPPTTRSVVPASPRTQAVSISCLSHHDLPSPYLAAQQHNSRSPPALSSTRKAHNSPNKCSRTAALAAGNTTPPSPGLFSLSVAAVQHEDTSGKRKGQSAAPRPPLVPCPLRSGVGSHRGAGAGHSTTLPPTHSIAHSRLVCGVYRARVVVAPRKAAPDVRRAR